MTPDMQAYLEALDAHIDARIHHSKVCAPKDLGVYEIDPDGAERCQEEARTRVKQTRFAMRRQLEKLLKR